MDASGIARLANAPFYGALSDHLFSGPRFAQNLVGLLARGLRAGPADPVAASNLHVLIQVLSFLEQWVLAEVVVADAQAVAPLKTHKSPSEQRELDALLEMFVLEELPYTAKRHAADTVVNLSESLLSSPTSALAGIFDRFQETEFSLKDGYYSKLNGILGNSDNSVERALFYFELASELRIPLLLHPDKVVLLERMARAFEASFDITYRRLVDEVRSALRFGEAELPIPPIADMIVTEARHERLSLKDAARRIRERGEIIAFRKLIGKLTRISLNHERVRFRSELTRASEKIAESIATRGSVAGHISRRIINLAEIPRLGVVLKILGGGHVAVPDVILSEPPFMAMFSRWANESPA